jgi:hypothetical protein
MNARARLATAAAALALLAAAPALGQEMNLAKLDDGPANRVYLRTGAEWAFVAGLGYARSFSLGQRRLLLLGELTAPWASVDASDYQVRLGAMLPILRWRGYQLSASLQPTLRGTKNDVSRMTSIGANAGLTGGHYAAHWFVAGELGFDYALATGIKHTQLYRDTVYQGARDGWYINPGGNHRLGAQAGASFGRHDLVVRAGILREMMGGIPLFPVYATLTFVTGW